MITAVIPAFNAEKTISEVVKRTAKYVDKVIVVDDGSTDRTAINAKKAGATVIRHPKNQGKAAAVITGIRKAKGVVVLLDADLQHLPEEIPKLVAPILKARCDLCIGSRFLGDPKQMPFHRKLTNYLSKLAIYLRKGIWITDVQSGFRALSPKAKELDLGDVQRYELETVMLLRAIDAGLSITEVPVTTVYGGVSHFGYIRDTRRVVWALLTK